MSKVSTWVSGQNMKSGYIGYSDVQKFINYTFSILVYEKTAQNVLRRLGHNQTTCITKTAGFTKPNDQLKQEWMEFITKMKKENRLYLHASVVHSIDVNYSNKPKTGVTTFSSKQGGKEKADSKTLLYINAMVTIISGEGINLTPWMLFTRDPKMAKEQKDADRVNVFKANLRKRQTNLTSQKIVLFM